jgi:CHAT domain-containing protein
VNRDSTPSAREIPPDTLTLNLGRRSGGSRLDELQRELARADEEYQHAVREVRDRHDPGYDPDRPVPPVSFAQMRGLIPADVRTALVQFTLTARRGVAIVITAERPHLVPFAAGWTARRAEELADEWSDLCRRYRDSKDSGGWNRALDRLLQVVEEGLLGPLAAVLRAENVRRVVLAPHRGLHVLPLHAGRCPPTGTRFADLFDEVLYTPSLSVLFQCARRPRAPGGSRLLVENPTFDLPFAALEGRLIQGLYPDIERLAEDAASREAVLDRAAWASIVHYCGHTVFDERDPLGSSLVLESQAGPPDRWVSLRDIFYRLRTPHNLLTVISGCESGRLRPDRVDEYLNFPVGFLFAGSSCVVNTLWTVDDLSTALFMAKFHETWKAGDPSHVAAALAAARRWLRDEIPRGAFVRDVLLPRLLTPPEVEAARDTYAEELARLEEEFPTDPPFAGPIHWAAAIATGLGFRPPQDATGAEAMAR